MPRKGTAYRVDEDWRTRAEKRIGELGMTRAALARAAGCARSLITELLEGERQQTTYLPEIHQALKWEPPQPPLASPDSGEISYLFERLDEAGRERIIREARGELDRLLKLDSAKKLAKRDGSKKNS